MADLEFEFKELLDEIGAIERIASNFLAPGSESVFYRMKQGLFGIQQSRHYSKQAWEIDLNSPLRTVVSNGDYESNAGGRYRVYAELSSIWEIRPVNPGKNSKPVRSFTLAGKASTLIRLIGSPKGQTDVPLAMWKLEVADNAAPGCYFHVQIHQDEDTPPFPKALSVPRLPFFLATPLVALEYVLGELFQSRWEKEGLTDSDHLRLWRRIQSKRLRQLLHWQHAEIAQELAVSSPWMLLKRLQPSPGLFL